VASTPPPAIAAADSPKAELIPRLKAVRKSVALGGGQLHCNKSPVVDTTPPVAGDTPPVVVTVVLVTFPSSLGAALGDSLGDSLGVSS